MTEREMLKEIFKKTDYQNRPDGMKANLATQFTEYGLNQIIDSILSNGVIVLPCREGDTVYAFCDTFGVVLPYLVDTLSIGYMGKNQSYYGYSAYCHAEETDELLDDIEFDLDDIGKTVFLTEEEAEKALAERVQKNES